MNWIKYGLSSLTASNIITIKGTKGITLQIFRLWLIILGQEAVFEGESQTLLNNDKSTLTKQGKKVFNSYSDPMCFLFSFAGIAEKR